MKRIPIESFAGRKFGRLKIQSDAVKNGRFREVVCMCDCGKLKVINLQSVLLGRSRSCGCWNSELISRMATTHGDTKRGLHSAEYRSWRHMRERCTNPNTEQYPNYGGRGISICERWRDSFENFLADMGRRPVGTKSIERKDTNGNYEPQNCKWAGWLEQANNTRKNRHLSFGGKTQTLAQWARETGLDPRKIRKRVAELRWSDERALTTP